MTSSKKVLSLLTFICLLTSHLNVLASDIVYRIDLPSGSKFTFSRQEKEQNYEFESQVGDAHLETAVSGTAQEFVTSQKTTVNLSEMIGLKFFELNLKKDPDGQIELYYENRSFGREDSFVIVPVNGTWEDYLQGKTVTFVPAQEYQEKWTRIIIASVFGHFFNFQRQFRLASLEKGKLKLTEAAPFVSSVNSSLEIIANSTSLILSDTGTLSSQEESNVRWKNFSSGRARKKYIKEYSKPFGLVCLENYRDILQTEIKQMETAIYLENSMAKWLDLPARVLPSAE